MLPVACGNRGPFLVDLLWESHDVASSVHSWHKNFPAGKTGAKQRHGRPVTLGEQQGSNRENLGGSTGLGRHSGRYNVEEQQRRRGQRPHLRVERYRWSGTAYYM